MVNLYFQIYDLPVYLFFLLSLERRVLKCVFTISLSIGGKQSSVIYRAKNLFLENIPSFLDITRFFFFNTIMMTRYLFLYFLIIFPLGFSQLAGNILAVYHNHTICSAYINITHYESMYIIIWIIKIHMIIAVRCFKKIKTRRTSYAL